MNDIQIIRKYKKIGTGIGALLVGIVFLIAACLQPLDGVPGYQLITKEDFSIAFGFAFSFAVGAVLGGVAGSRIGDRLGKQYVDRLRQSPSIQKPLESDPRRNSSTQPDPSLIISQHQLLNQLLKSMPRATQQQVGIKFSSVTANFEFFTWVPLTNIQRAGDEASQRGFSIWGNTDATSAILYGAGLVEVDDFADTIIWLRAITECSKEGTAHLMQPQAADRFIEFDSSGK